MRPVPPPSISVSELFEYSYGEFFWRCVISLRPSIRQSVLFFTPGKDRFLVIYYLHYVRPRLDGEGVPLRLSYIALLPAPLWKLCYSSNRNSKNLPGPRHVHW